MYNPDDSKRIDRVNKIVFNQNLIQRKDDMSPTDSLTLICQDDGDIVLEIFSEDDGCGDTVRVSVEFCSPGMGCGGSPRTHKALRDLFVAMVEDQCDERSAGRAGNFVVEEKVKPFVDIKP